MTPYPPYFFSTCRYTLSISLVIHKSKVITKSLTDTHDVDCFGQQIRSRPFRKEFLMFLILERTSCMMM